RCRRRGPSPAPCAARRLVLRAVGRDRAGGQVGDAPQVERGVGAVRPPALAALGQFARARRGVQAIHPPRALGHAQAGVRPRERRWVGGWWPPGLTSARASRKTSLLATVQWPMPRVRPSAAAISLSRTVDMLRTVGISPRASRAARPRGARVLLPETPVARRV